MISGVPDRKTAISILGVAISASIFSPMLFAQTAFVLEEILVTAQKREQNLQDVGVAVTAFSREALESLNVVTSLDIAAQTPGLNIGTPVGEGNNPSITLRGVGLNDFNDNNEGPIAVYRDDVYQSAQPGLTFQLFDMERVEVLRGPQGTLYGRNATGGLVHFISAKPTEETEAYIDLTVASNNQAKLEGAVSGSLGNAVQGRLSASFNRHDGYVENRIGPDANEADSLAVRGQLNIDFSENVSALISVNNGDSDTNAPQYQHQATDDGSGVAGIADFYGYIDTDGDNFAGEFDREGVLDIESRGASVTVDWSTEAFSLVSITAFQTVDKLHQEDSDVGPNEGILPQFASENEQFSQEFRFSIDTDAARWVVGAFFFDNEVDGALDLDLNFPGPLVDAITGAPAGTFGTDFVPFFSYDVDYLQDTQSVALFSQVEYDFSPKWGVTAGLRFTDEERSFSYQNLTTSSPDSVVNSCLIPAGDVCGLVGDPAFPGTDTFFDFTDANPEVGNLDEIDVTNLSGQVSLNYRPTDDILVFGKVSRGFKSGGFNSGFLDFTDGVLISDIPFEEEILTSFELGVKSNLAGNTLRINATAFFYDYEDYQALTFSGLSQFINNSDAEVSGLDLEVQWLPIEKLDISIGASFLDTDVDSVIVRGVGAVEGSNTVLAPEFTFNALVRYIATDNFSIQVDYNHQGEHFFDITNSDVSREGAYNVWNTSASYDVSDNLRLKAFVKNLTDEEYRVYTFDFTAAAGFNQQFFAPPRWVGVGASYTF